MGDQKKYSWFILGVLFLVAGCSDDPSDSLVQPGSGFPQITDLEAHRVTSSRVLLIWTYPDDFYGDKGVYFHARCSSEEITLGNWFEAELCRQEGPGHPAVAGERDTIEVMLLKSDTDYYFALRGNKGGEMVAPVSNNCLVRTLEQDHLDYEGRYAQHRTYFSGIFPAGPGYMALHGWTFHSYVPRSHVRFVPLTAPFETSGYDSYPAFGFASKEDHFCTIAGTSDIFDTSRYFNVYSGPPDPEFLGRLQLRPEGSYTSISGLALGATRAYVGIDGAVRMIDIQSPDSPVFSTTEPELLEVPVMSLAVHNSALIAFSGGEEPSLILADIGDPDVIQPLKRHDIPGPIKARAIFGGFMCLLVGDHRLLVFDLDDPGLDGPVATRTFPHSVTHMAAGSGRIFTMTEEYGIEIFALNASNEIELVGTFDITRNGDYLKVVNDMLCIHEGGYYDYISILLCRIKP